MTETMTKAVRVGARAETLEEVTKMLLYAIKKDYSLQQFAQIFVTYSVNEQIRFKAFDDQVTAEIRDGRGT